MVLLGMTTLLRMPLDGVGDSGRCTGDVPEPADATELAAMERRVPLPAASSDVAVMPWDGVLCELLALCPAACASL